TKSLSLKEYNNFFSYTKKKNSWKTINLLDSINLIINFYKTITILEKKLIPNKNTKLNSNNSLFYEIIIDKMIKDEKNFETNNDFRQSIWSCAISFLLREKIDTKDIKTHKHLNLIFKNNWIKHFNLIFYQEF
ncbi:unnamed protein product, partial [marine sediment metagenome]